MIIEEFTFELSSPLKYQCATGEDETTTILLKAPAFKNEKTVSKLRQKCGRAFLSARKQFGNDQNSEEIKEAVEQRKALQANKDPDSADQMDPAELIMFLQISEDDFYTIQEAFYGLLLNGIGFIPENIKLTQSLINKISLDDKERMLGEYFVNFILPSWMKQAQKT